MSTRSLTSETDRLPTTPSMEKLIQSMRCHLLLPLGAGGGGPDGPTTPGLHDEVPPTNSYQPPSCSTPTDIGKYPKVDMDATPTRIGEVFRVPGEERWGVSLGGIRAGCQGSRVHGDAQFTSSDLPLSNGFRNQNENDVNTVAIDVDADHLQYCSSFYMTLREKYPRAFQRRSSISSETNSVSSKVELYQPNRTMSPMPKGHYLLPSTHGIQPTSSGATEHLAVSSRDGLPPRPPSYSHRHHHATATSQFYHEESRHVESVAKHMREDLTITGSTRSCSSWKPQGLVEMSPTVISPDNSGPPHGLSMYQIQGILKRDLNVPNASMTPVSSIGTKPESTLSLKERLHKNKATLRALLSEENNPLRKRKARTQHELNKSFESDMTLDGDLTTLSIETDCLPSVRSENGLLQIQTELDRLEAKNRILSPAHQRPKSPIYHRPPLHHAALSPSHILSQKNLVITSSSQRSLADRPQRKHVATKRYISPDSSHDSAVDMDTASLQSSPGSSDTQTTVITRTTARGNQQICHGGVLSPGEGQGNWSVDTVDGCQVPPRELPPNLVTGHHDYHQLHQMGRHNNKADSDVDSGIAHGPYLTPLYRDRHDSSSSTENDPELDPSSRVEGGHRYTPISSQDIRSVAAQRARAGRDTAGIKYSGPLKADHTIQPASPKHTNREQIQSGGLPLSSRKSASTQDLSQKRASPINRVRFEDEERQLGPQHRAQSHPQLSMGCSTGEGATVGSRQMEQLNVGEAQSIPSGCRALKLRGARKSAANMAASPAGSAHGGLSPQPLSVTEGGGGLMSGNRGAEKHGLPPSGKHEDLNTRMQRLRARTLTPTQVIHAAAADAQISTDTRLPVHRASPVIIAQNGASSQSMDLPHNPAHSYLSDTPSSDNEPDLHNEVAYFNGFNDAWMHALANPSKKSKKPWRKNKGQYNPIDSTEHHLQKEIAHKPRAEAARASNGLPEQYAELNYAKGWLKSGLNEQPASCTAEINSPASRQKEDPYEEVDGAGYSRSRPVENQYEEVQFQHRGDDKNQAGADNTYAVPSKLPKPRPKKTNPCVVNMHDESIYQEEEAPPVPDRGYASDLERYKDLSGSRTSLSGKMDSFRKAAKNKWSALRRAVSLEKVDKAGTEEGVLSNLKKSPSLQSLTKRFSFSKKKEKATFSGLEMSGLPPTNPTRKRPTRPSSASIGRFKRHSSSMTSITSVDAPQNFRPIGKLKQLNDDGTQIVELVRPPHGPFGFYIARGNARYGGGVFVSRLSDGLPEHFFAGLLGVGDEILEINCQLITNLTLDEVYAMMAERHHLLIKTLPYMARKDT